MDVQKHQKRLVTVLVMFCAINTCASRASANLIQDGWFELPVVGPGGLNSGFWDFAPGQSIDGAWKVIGSGELSVYPCTESGPAGVLYTTAEGCQALDLTGAYDNGAHVGVEQQVATTPGMRYLLGGSMGNLNNPAYNPYSGTTVIDVLINERVFETFTNGDVSGLSINWKPFSLVFTATANVTTIGFLNETAAGVGVGPIDNVTMEAVTNAAPEPSAWLMLATGAGLISLGTLRQRRTSI